MADTARLDSQVAPRAIASGRDRDVDLANGFDRLPDTDETGLHDKAVAGLVDDRLAILGGDFDDAGNDVAELEGLALDRVGEARGRFPDTGMDVLNCGSPEISLSGVGRPSRGAKEGLVSMVLRSDMVVLSMSRFQ